jgi:hypothetical protein
MRRYWADVEYSNTEPGSHHNAPSPLPHNKNTQSTAAPLWPSDWKCPKCQATNFSRRVVCFLCSAEKPEGEEHNVARVCQVIRTSGWKVVEADKTVAQY